MYDIGKKQGHCFIWHQSEAERGATEIATCLLKFIRAAHETGIKTIILYSDNCGGQNRSRFVFSMLEYAANTLKIDITHRFLEKGHTQNERDSMHVTIENAKKHKFIYVPKQ